MNCGTLSQRFLFRRSAAPVHDLQKVDYVETVEPDLRETEFSISQSEQEGSVEPVSETEVPHTLSLTLN